MEQNSPLICIILYHIGSRYLEIRRTLLNLLSAIVFQSLMHFTSDRLTSLLKICGERRIPTLMDVFNTYYCTNCGVSLGIILDYHFHDSWRNLSNSMVIMHIASPHTVHVI